MLASVLDQAAALEQVLATKSMRRDELTALLDCCVRLALAGESVRALQLLDASRDQVLETEPSTRLRFQCALVRALMDSQRFGDALGAAESVLATLLDEVVGSNDHGILRTYEAHCLVRLNRSAEALRKLEGLRAELLCKPDSELLSSCLNVIAAAHIRAGLWDLGREFALEAWVSARRCGSELHAGFALGNICIAERGKCRWDSAADAARSAIAALTSAGALPAADHARRSLSIALLKQGRCLEVIAAAQELLANSQRRTRSTDRAYALQLESLAKLHLGQAEAARESLGLAELDNGALSESRPELLRLEYLGDVELEQGHAEAALKRYDEVLPHALALIPRGDVVAELRRRRAECYLMLGRPQEAYDEAKAALELCLELGDRYEEAATYRTIALASAARGRHDEAKKHFVHGFAMYDDIETPYEWGKLWMAYGDWLCGPNAGAYESLTGAREAYRAACDHFEHMGAELKLSHARERAARLEKRLVDEGISEPAAGEKPRPRRRPSLDRELQRRVQWAHDTFALVTRHRPLIELLEQVATVAVSDIPVLVLGESGTGKELIARGVHALSGRTGSMVEVNCSAVPATMMEAEFFGSIHGSYTGSTRDRAGLFEEGHQGSVFLDEIGDMPVDLQSKLLRFLETGEVRRIGANSGRKVDARLIAATNRDASKLQAGDMFRPDLYYRLAHAVFTLPPLRSRGDDVTLLVDHFLDKFTQESRKHMTLSGAARERFTSYSWPGNVRQLRALIQRLVVQTPEGKVITPRDIPLTETADAPRNFVEEMEGQEKSRILEALEKTQFIKADAARILRMSRTTLLGKMKRYGIPG